MQGDGSLQDLSEEIKRETEDNIRSRTALSQLQKSTSSLAHPSKALTASKKSLTSSAQVTSMVGTLRKTKLYGKQTNKKRFMFPENADEIIQEGKEFVYDNKHMFGITCGIFEAIGSIMIDFTDGSASPYFGTESNVQMNCKLEVPNNERVVGARIRHKKLTASIQNITFLTNKGSEIEFNGSLDDGEWEQFDLKPKERIIGIYGCCWSEKQPELVGLGFIIFTPKVGT